MIGSCSVEATAPGVVQDICISADMITRFRPEYEAVMSHNPCVPYPLG